MKSKTIYNLSYLAVLVFLVFLTIGCHTEKEEKPECEADESLCTEEGLLQHCAEGRWVQSYCDFGFSCVEGACESAFVPCETGAKRCNEAGARVLCEGGKEVARYCGSKQVCDNGECVLYNYGQCNEDTPKACINGQLSSCGEDGRFTITPCPSSHPICDKGECKQCLDDYAVSSCSGDKTRLECIDGQWVSETCTGRQHCSGGLCLPSQICVGNAITCQDDGQTMRYCASGFYYDYPCEAFGEDFTCLNALGLVYCTQDCDSSLEGYAHINLECRGGKVDGHVCMHVEGDIYKWIPTTASEVCSQSGEIVTCESNKLVYTDYGNCRTTGTDYLNLRVERRGTVGSACDQEGETQCYGSKAQLHCQEGIWALESCPGREHCQLGECQLGVKLPVNSPCDSLTSVSYCENASAYNCEYGRITQSDECNSPFYTYGCTIHNGEAICVMPCTEEKEGLAIAYEANTCASYGVLYHYFCTRLSNGELGVISDFSEKTCMDDHLIECSKEGQVITPCKNCRYNPVTGSAHCEEE